MSTASSFKEILDFLIVSHSIDEAEHYTLKWINEIPQVKVEDFEQVYWFAYNPSQDPGSLLLDWPDENMGKNKEDATQFTFKWFKEFPNKSIDEFKKLYNNVIEHKTSKEAEKYAWLILSFEKNGKTKKDTNIY